MGYIDEWLYIRDLVYLVYAMTKVCTLWITIIVAAI